MGRPDENRTTDSNHPSWKASGLSYTQRLLDKMDCWSLGDIAQTKPMSKLWENDS
jgi:hypothetical protein